MMPSNIHIYSLRIGEKRERKRGEGREGRVGEGLKTTVHSNSSTLESVVHVYLISQTHHTLLNVV